MVEQLVAAVTGQSYSQFLQAEILAPLGMTHTRCAEAPFPIGSYAPSFTGAHPDPQVFTNTLRAGGLYSTPGDMGRLAMMLMNGGRYGNTRVLSQQAVDEMGTDQTARLVFNPTP